MNNTSKITIGVTGHRPQRLFTSNPYGEANQRKLEAFAQQTLEHAGTHRIKGVITGMALGWDQAVAEACLRLGLPFVAAVPFEGQESRWVPDAQRRYRELLEASAGVYVISKGGFSREAMMTRNMWIADRASSMIALYDGGRSGGTAQCVRYAEANGVSVWRVWQEWLACR